jgi:glycosyltransferase involved in cell wall biosynthesis
MTDLTHIRILYLITKSNWGGAQHYVYTLATEAKKAGAEVGVACGGTGARHAPTGLLVERLTAAGVRTYPVSAFMRDISLVQEMRAFRELVRLIRDVQPDILHVNSSKAGGLGALAGRVAGVPRIIFTAHGWPFWEERPWLVRALLFFFSWLTALLAHRVIVVSDYDRQVTRSMPGISRKTVRIYNGIDLSTPLGSGAVIRDAFPPGVSITGTIGETTRNKNQAVLIEAARQDPSRYVAIVGTDGDERPRLEALIARYQLNKRVKLFGYIPWHEVLRGFDTFALPSVKEGLPYVLIEARLAGLPIEANRSVGGIAEILDAPDLSLFSLSTMLQGTFALYKH